MNRIVSIRVVIEGEVPADFLPEVLEFARHVTPVDGGLTIAVGAHATPLD